jgi:hypothetical protein
MSLGTLHATGARPLIDYGTYLNETVYPALFRRLDSAFPEYGWTLHGDAWVATRWPADFPVEAQHKRPDRLMVYQDSPWWIKVHGHGGARFLDLVNGGRKPSGAEFLAAVRRLCDLAGVPFPEREISPEVLERQRRQEARSAVLEDLSVCCQGWLWGEQGSKALEFLRQRGFADAQIHELRLGLYLSADLVRSTLLGAGHPPEDVQEAGVISQRWEGFVTVPWAQERGRALTIYGRWHEQIPPLMRDLPAWVSKRRELLKAWSSDQAAAWEEPRIPKTLALAGKNTKGVPYCLDRALRAGHREIVLVEGVFDAAYLQVSGETRAVSSAAAQLSGEQVKCLRRCQISLAFVCGDPDGGGDRGTVANVKDLLGAGITPSVVPRLPEGIDPDEYVRTHGIDAWKALVRQSIHGLRHLANCLLAEVGERQPGEDDYYHERVAASLVKLAKELPADRPNELAQYLLAPIADATGCAVESLRERLAQKGGAGPAGRPPTSAYQPFPLDALPPIVREYVSASAEAIGCDPSLVAIPALAVLASCIGNSRAIQLKRRWSEPCVLWTATVAMSGGHKSPAFHAVVDPLFQIHLDRVEAYKELKDEHQQQLKDWRAKRRDERGEEPPPPKEPACFLTSDSTIETAGELLEDNPRGILLARDELDAWLQSFTRYKGRGGGTDRPHWLEFHRAGPLNVHRKTGERTRLCVPRCAVSVTGTIQPKILQRALDEDALDAGLGARFLLAMPGRRQRRWSEADVEEELEQKYQQLLRDLLKLSLADARKRKPHFLGLSPPAKRLFVDFYNEWGEVQFASEGAQEAAFAKLEGYAPRLILLHHVVCLAAAQVDDTRAITEASVIAGIKLVRWFAAEAGRVYAMLRESDQQRQTRELIEWIEAHGGRVTVRQVQKSNHHRWSSSAAVEAALNALVGAGLGQWEEADAPRGGGHRQRWFVLFPPASASDTSDTRHDARANGNGHASDTRPDTCPERQAGASETPDATHNGANGYAYDTLGGDERVSEVSEADAKEGCASG